MRDSDGFNYAELDCGLAVGKGNAHRAASSYSAEFGQHSYSISIVKVHENKEGGLNVGKD